MIDPCAREEIIVCVCMGGWVGGGDVGKLKEHSHCSCKSQDCSRRWRRNPAEACEERRSLRPP